MGPSRIFILRPVATALFMVAIVLAGLVGEFEALWAEYRRSQ